MVQDIRSILYEPVQVNTNFILPEFPIRTVLKKTRLTTLSLGLNGSN
jgi:hypothetical protein